jgi:transcriptional regulator with XRE-family HTH domain
METARPLHYGARMETVRPIGDHLREWRQRRRLSQLDLALEAEISTKHLSFLETGRAQPSREMVLKLAEQLEVPLRERNVLLVSAVYAPVFPQRGLEDPALKQARKAVDLVLKGHEPYPAIAVDRHWTLVAHNAAVPPLLANADPALLQPPVNVLRLSLHPKGLAPQIENLGEWRAHLLMRLRQQIDVTADGELTRLMDELAAYPAPGGARSPRATLNDEYAGVVVPLRYRTQAGTLSLFSTTTIFGTPVDVTLAELAIESFFPADAATAELLRAAG